MAAWQGSSGGSHARKLIDKIRPVAISPAMFRQGREKLLPSPCEASMIELVMACPASQAFLPLFPDFSIFDQESFNVAVLLKTGIFDELSLSLQK